jgi:PPP family 3-phenylpropionic acid transporter
LSLTQRRLALSRYLLELGRSVPVPRKMDRGRRVTKMLSSPPLLAFVLLFGALYAAFGVSSPFFPAFLQSRSLQPTEITTVLAAGTAVRLLVAPVAGHVADALRTTRLVLGACLLATAALISAYVFTSGLWPLVIVSLVSSVALGPVAPLADALALQGARGGHFEYGWVRGAGSAAFIAGTSAAGVVVGHFGLSAIVVVQAVLLAVSALIAFVAPAAQPPPLSEDASRPEDGRGGIRRLLALPAYRRVLLVAALVFGSHAMHDSFAAIRWSQAGISSNVIGLLWSESVAAEVLVFFVAGPAVLRRLRPATVAALCASAGILRWTTMAFTAWLPAVALVQPLHGLTFALLHLACMSVLGAVVPRPLVATALTVYGTLGAGLAAVLLTLAAGPLYGTYGPVAFLAMATLCAVAIPVALHLSPPVASR